MFTVAFNIPALWELETVRNDNFQPSLFDNLTSGVLIVSEGDSVYEVITSSLRHNDVYNKVKNVPISWTVLKINMRFYFCKRSSFLFQRPYILSGKISPTH